MIGLLNNYPQTKLSIASNHLPIIETRYQRKNKAGTIAKVFDFTALASFLLLI